MQVVEQVDARKAPYDGERAKEILSAAKTVYVVKGKKILTFEMAKANMDDVLAVALGPTGNLRAPSLRKGDTLVIGFDEATYRDVLG